MSIALMDLLPKRLTTPFGRLGAAAQNALEVARFGGLRTDEEPSPYDVVSEQRVYRLRHYLAGDQRTGPPVLLVPPMMLAAEVYDVSPSTSAVTVLKESPSAWPPPVPRSTSWRSMPATSASSAPRPPATAGPWWRAGRGGAPGRAMEFYAATEAGAILINVSGAKLGSMGRTLPGAEVRIAAYDIGARRLAREQTSTTPLRGVFAREDAWVATSDLSVATATATSGAWTASPTWCRHPTVPPSPCPSVTPSATSRPSTSRWPTASGCRAPSTR